MRITSSNSVLVFVDVQERLFPHMYNSEQLKMILPKLAQGANELGIPVIHSQQYTKGLGETIPELAEHLSSEHIEKNSFSCYDSEEFAENPHIKDAKVILLCGIESHVCVLQTAIDSIANGKIPVIITDCTGSRKQSDSETSYSRVISEGGHLATFESILLEITRFSGTPTFKNISKLLK